MMALSKEQIDMLLALVNKGIDVEIKKICDAPTEPLLFDSLITEEDVTMAHCLWHIALR